MKDPPVFDHERLDVYRLGVEFLAWLGELLDEGPLRGCKLKAVKHLDDSSRSIVNNIAEGNGKRSHADRCRFFDMARGSALECASCLDVLVARKRLDPSLAVVGKDMLVRIVSMLTKLTERLLGVGSLSGRVRDPRRAVRASEPHEQATEGEVGRARAAPGRHPVRDA
jgi:four helix bundle protein